MNVTIQDDWLPWYNLHIFKEYVLNVDFPWYKCEVVAEEGIAKSPIEQHPKFASRQQFVHAFLDDYGLDSSGGSKFIHEMGKLLNAKKLYRCKLNYGMRTVEPTIGGWHQDYMKIKEWPNLKIALLYLNTNNGYTILEDGTKIESIENRLAIFDNSVIHTDCSQTDTEGRLVLNIAFTTKD
jgi:hypothetical protein